MKAPSEPSPRMLGRAARFAIVSAADLAVIISDSLPFREIHRRQSWRRYTMDDIRVERTGVRAVASAGNADHQPLTRATGTLGIGAAAFGAVALGATAIGALAIGRLAINALALKRARVRTLTVDHLQVRRLHVGELIVHNVEPSLREG